MDNIEFHIKNKISKLPQIKRASQYHIYTQSGRMLDMYLNGSEVFGYRLESLIHSLKNNLSKGLLCEYPHKSKARIYNFINSLYPNFKIKFFQNKERLLNSLKDIGIKLDSDYFHSYKDLSVFDEISVSQHRLFLPIANVKKQILIPLYPIPCFLQTQMLIVSDDIKDSIVEDDIPVVSLFYIADIFGYYSKVLNFNPNIPRPKHYKLGKNMKFFSKEHYNSFDIEKNFEIDFCYIKYKHDEKSYDTMFETCLKNDILLNPYYRGVSILPSLISDGEKKKVEILLNFDYNM